MIAVVTRISELRMHSNVISNTIIGSLKSVSTIRYLFEITRYTKYITHNTCVDEQEGMPTSWITILDLLTATAYMGASLTSASSV